MKKFNDGDRVEIDGLGKFRAEEWGLTEDDFEELLEHNHQLATIDCEACDDYYDIIFDDGYLIEAISDYHITLYIAKI